MDSLLELELSAFGEIIGENGEIEHEGRRGYWNEVSGRAKQTETGVEFDTTLMSETERQEFAKGFTNAAAPGFDAQNDEDSYCPWQCPWYTRKTIEVNAPIHAHTTAYELGKAWWAQCVADGYFDNDGNYIEK